MFHFSLSPGKAIFKSKIKVIFAKEWKESVGCFPQKSFVTWELYQVLDSGEALPVDQFWGRIREVCDIFLGALLVLQPVCNASSMACNLLFYRFGGGWSLLSICSTRVLVLFVGLGAPAGKGKPSFVF